MLVVPTADPTNAPPPNRRGRTSSPQFFEADTVVLEFMGKSADADSTRWYTYWFELQPLSVLVVVGYVVTQVSRSVRA